MRELTYDEVNFVAGGDGTDGDGGEIIVIGTSGVGGGYLGSGSYDSSGGSPTSGPQDHSPAGPGKRHYTPHGYSYTVSNTLSASQTAVLDDIVEFGITHGKSSSEIAAVAALAFAESSLNPDKGSGSTHAGLGQYSTDEWRARGETGSISSAQDQIKALYHDFDYYAQRYAEKTATNDYGINDAHVSMLEYYEIKHHGGSNETNWNKIDPLSGDPKTHADDITYRQEIHNAYNYLGWQMM